MPRRKNPITAAVENQIEPKYAELVPKPKPARSKTKAVEQTVAASLIRKAAYRRFEMWVIGDTPLITHAWSEKARREMLEKQVKTVRAGREARDPHSDFVSSLYDMGVPGVYGFPATGFKNCVLSVAHKDKGIARSAVMAGLWIDATMVRTRPALAGAICDVPLLRIYGSEPEMREDMVRVGVGLTKSANLAYRAQFTTWAFRVTGRFNEDILNTEALGFLVDEAGIACGLGEWRNEKRGLFGAFHRATATEQAAWDAFADGRGPLPALEYALAAE